MTRCGPVRSCRRAGDQLCTGGVWMLFPVLLVSSKSEEGDVTRDGVRDSEFVDAEDRTVTKSPPRVRGDAGESLASAAVANVKTALNACSSAHRTFVFPLSFLSHNAVHVDAKSSNVRSPPLALEICTFREHLDAIVAIAARAMMRRSWTSLDDDRACVRAEIVRWKPELAQELDTVPHKAADDFFAVTL